MKVRHRAGSTMDTGLQVGDMAHCRYCYELFDVTEQVDGPTCFEAKRMKEKA